MKEFEIWSEGYRATGEDGDATFHGKYPGETFDEAVEYANSQSTLNAERYTPECFWPREAYNNRRSNWKIWGCALFDNEADARKSFG